jgi:hypothetical protein
MLSKPNWVLAFVPFIPDTGRSGSLLPFKPLKSAAPAAPTHSDLTLLVTEVGLGSGLALISVLWEFDGSDWLDTEVAETVNGYIDLHWRNV